MLVNQPLDRKGSTFDIQLLLSQNTQSSSLSSSEIVGRNGQGPLRYDFGEVLRAMKEEYYRLVDVYDGEEMSEEASIVEELKRSASFLLSLLLSSTSTSV